MEQGHAEHTQGVHSFSGPSCGRASSTYEEVPSIATQVGAGKHGEVGQRLDAAKAGQIRMQHLT